VLHNGQSVTKTRTG